MRGSPSGISSHGRPGSLASDQLPFNVKRRTTAKTPEPVYAGSPQCITCLSRLHRGDKGVTPLKLLRGGERHRTSVGLAIVAGVATAGSPKRHRGEASDVVGTPTTNCWRTHAESEGSKGQGAFFSASFANPVPVMLTTDWKSPKSPN
eukprot:7382619-Prymnesium_polylepis.2